MLKKILSFVVITLLFLFLVVFFVPYDKEYKVSEVKSPVHFLIEDMEIFLDGLESFDNTFTVHNSNLAKQNNISEEEAFILGNLSLQWADSLMKNRKVYLKNNVDLIYNKHSYREKFLHSGFCFVNSKPYVENLFFRKIKSVRMGNYKVYDLDTDKVYNPSDPEVRALKNFIVIRKNHLPKSGVKNSNPKVKNPIYEYGEIKIVFADSTSNLKPFRSCSSSVCKEILDNINNAKSSIDMAIYGYSGVYEIEEAIQKAINRGVKIRLVYDVDSKGKNIYPDTDVITNLVPKNPHDGASADSKNIMHNKFYIFDDSVLITGSANLSHTDMSGFNTNSIVVIKSKQIAGIYKKEFEQMYNGKFHTEKEKILNNKINVSGIPIEVYFSPKDKAITSAVLPLIRSAKKYIYIPTFVLTERRVAEELIKAKARGVDVKVIIDALSASNIHSKHNLLRANKLSVKTENYAGKMHSKSIIADDKYTIIGSMNFSYSGENKNDENLVLIQDETITKFYKKFFLEQWNKIDDKWLNFDPKSEGFDSIGSCYDGIDNDYDGTVDSKDIACIK